MFKLISSLLFCCVLANASVSAQSADEKAVTDAVEILRTALITPDKNVLESLSADDLSYGHSNGRIEDKAAFVDALVSGKTKFTAVSFTDQTIKITGNTAVVRHRMMADLNNNNTPTKIDIVVLLVWEKQKGRWRLLARQGVKIPA